LHDNFKIDLKHQISIVQGHDMLYKPIVNNFCMRTKGFKDLDLRNEDPFCKVLVIMKQTTATQILIMNVGQDKKFPCHGKQCMVRISGATHRRTAR